MLISLYIVEEHVTRLKCACAYMDARARARACARACVRACV